MSSKVQLDLKEDGGNMLTTSEIDDIITYVSTC